MKQARLIFSGMKILTNENWLNDHALIVENKKIMAIIPRAMIQHHLPARQYEFPSNFYLSPGLIDFHIHGANGHDVMDGSEEALQEISMTLAKEGVTGFLATTMAASNAEIEKVLTLIPQIIARQQEGVAILGVHLEGPFIAAGKRGAQHINAIQHPSIDLLQHWQLLAKGNIKILTLAPELPGAIPLIRAMRDLNIIASIGHTMATYEETKAAIAAGARQATHLFNAMSELHQREPGAAAAILLAEDVAAEIIVDGVHVHPAMVEVALRMKGKEQLLLVTDAMRAKCCGNGCYELGGQSVQVINGHATLKDGTLAGSVLTMNAAIKNIMLFTGCDLATALHMASTNQARLLQLENKGKIAIGMDADLVIFDSDLKTVLTLCEGREVFSKISY